MAIVWDSPAPAAAPSEAAPATPPPDASAAPSIDDIAGRIARIESRGQADPYTTLGPPTKTGDRAHGKYQVMGTNIPSWTEEALGKRLTPQEFLANPDAQEQTVKHRLTKYFDQYGNARDVASLWHSGVPYDRAVAEGRADSLGTTTQSYADRVAGGASGGHIVWDAAPSATAPNMTPAEEPTMSPAPPAEAPPAKPTFSRISDDQVRDGAVSLNTSLGLSPNHPIGHIAAHTAQQLRGAIADFGEGMEAWKHIVGGGPQAVEPLLKLLNGTTLGSFGSVGEAASELTDVGGTFGPEGVRPWSERAPISKVIGTMATLLSGAATPLPFAGSAEEVAMPLQGTRALRGTAAETAAAAEQAAKAAAITRGTGEIATAGAVQNTEDVAARGAEWTGAQRQASAEAVAAARQDTATAQQEAATAQQQAGEAAAKVEPSPAAATRARDALAPAGMTAKEGGQVTVGGMEQRLAEWKDPATGIYDSYVAGHANDVIADPAARRSIVDGITEMEQTLGLSGGPKKVLGELRDRIAAGDAITVKDVDNYKVQLDDMLPGRAKAGASLREQKLYDLKFEVRDLLRSNATGDEQEWLAAADNIYRNQVIGRDNPLAIGPLVRLVKKSPPAVVVERLFGNGTSDKAGAVAGAVMHELGDHPAATALQQSFMSRLIGQATRNSDDALTPAALLTKFEALNPAFVDAMANPGAKTFFRVLRQEQAAVEQTAGAAKSAGAQARTAVAQERAVAGTAKATTAQAEQLARGEVRSAKAQASTVRKITEAESGPAEATAAEAKKSADAAKAAAEAPNRIARFAAHGIRISTAGLVGKLLGGHGAAGGAAGLLLRSDGLALALANSKAANALARAFITGIKAPARTAVVPALLQALNDAGATVEPDTEPQEGTR